MNINIICVGKVKESFYRDAINEFTKRLSKYCKVNIYEVADEKTPDKASEAEENKILQKEGERIQKHMKEDDYVFALAIEGKKYDSVSFANEMEKLAIQGNSTIDFIIGGSLGIEPSIKKRADKLISFSDMTFPHQLMRVILLEQIYRGFRIINNEPYHK
ncbi:MAG: 23S rRNA (pseudouridine(1915)-N(3))-methyltransferase RlmH [Lachnospiraceae bacterium]|nr:23S rRNA (pseudouridine(1915)-N(3))-methyltransferase RlmH [Lachnospiraceae bacterium]